MDRKRAALLEQIEAGFGSEGGDGGDVGVGHTQLLALVNDSNDNGGGGGNGGFEWSNLVNTLGRKYHPRMCEAIARHAAAVLADAEGAVEAINAVSVEVEETEASVAAREAVAVLRVAVDVAEAFLANPKLPAPDALVQTVQALHDIMLHLCECGEAAQLQASIARVCEAWWVQGRTGRDTLSVQLVPYLLVTSLQPGARPGDVKRVWGMREAMLAMDFEDESITMLLELLLRCFTNPL